MSAEERYYIVCVDDEESVLEVLREQLYCHFGDRLNVEIASSGKEALAVIEDIMGSGEEVAILVADHFMPGLKGSELLQQVHAEHPQIKKVLLTGQAGLNSVVQAVNCGGLDYYLAKPWNESQLQNTLENLLKQYVLEKENAVEDFRKLIGATNPAEAAEGTIRALYAKSIGENAVHGADSDENAEREASFHFAQTEMF